MSAIDSRDPFWMVWNLSRRVPAFKHETEEGANAEARRLALDHPGDRFYVVEAKRYFETNAVRRIELDGIPF